MGKTPKRAAPGGDERNLYDRRLKATTAPSKPSDPSSHESSNRPKLSGIQKKIPSGQRKNLKTKLRATGKHGLSHPPKRLGRPPGTNKERKALSAAAKGEEPVDLNMKPESEDADVQLDVSIEKENNSGKNGEEIVKESVEPVVSEILSAPQEETSTIPLEVKETIVLEEQIESQEDKKDSEQNIQNQSKESEENEEIKLSFDADDEPIKVQEEKSEIQEEAKEEPQPSVQVEVRNGVHEVEDVPSEPQTDTESYSVDIVESTTSELSVTSETPENDAQKEKEQPADPADASFVSYDPTIMLKDVQIKLNDCLKENSKLYDISNAEPATPSQQERDLSFGKTLRNISGRHSINRMRHVTLREHRYSPNSSLYVNTSSMSLPQDETEDFKILRYSTGLSDTVATTNGSSAERKRKLENEGWSSVKKQKTESENSLLNTSISILKGLRRPIQISTPVSAFKFKSDKLDISELEEENKIVSEPMDNTKKWCVIM